MNINQTRASQDDDDDQPAVIPGRTRKNSGYSELDDKNKNKRHIEKIARLNKSYQIRTGLVDKYCRKHKKMHF